MDNLMRTKKLQSEMAKKNLNPELQKQVLRDYKTRKKRLLLLDYDGTLVPFAGEPADAIPDSTILGILTRLATDPSNEIVIISGRGRQTLDRWFGKTGVCLIAEHGVWIKKADGNWKMLKPLRDEWKKHIRPIMELYVDRTPGSHIEEKDFSIVWHYRQAEQQLAIVRASELRERLVDITAPLNLNILEGSKIIEVKNIGINKGVAAEKCIKKANWDYILAVGDDWTDEDTFSAVPEWAYTIKVGVAVTKARYTTHSPQDVRELLKRMASL
jgi:trehalose 6-phosphate synthase/phosphatase